MSRKIQYDVENEDEIVIANMNVEGMPWYQKDRKNIPVTNIPHDVPTNKETFMIILGSLKAALIIAGVFSVMLVLFTLFCTQIWFH